MDFQTLPLDPAIERVKGDGSRRLAVFADPDCSFCAQLGRELEGVDNVTIYTFLYPIPQLHPEAAARATRIWCAPDRNAAWLAWLLDRVEATESPTGCDAPTSRVAEIAPRFWVNGTPSLVFGSGRVLSGALGTDVLENFLSEAPLARDN